MNPTIQYTSNSFVITIETKCPAALHSLLLKGINEAVQIYISQPERLQNPEGLVALLQLQQAILPNEPELSKAYD